MQPDRDGVCCLGWIEVVVGQLEPWEDKQPVERFRAGCGALDCFEIRRVLGSVHAKRFVAVLLIGPRVVGSDDVVRDGENIEPRAPVEIDELVQLERTVTPGRVGVELGKQGARTRSHGRIVACVPVRVGRNVCLFQGRSDYA